MRYASREGIRLLFGANKVVIDVMGGLRASVPPKGEKKVL
jgi:hypothetical protein